MVKVNTKHSKQRPIKRPINLSSLLTNRSINTPDASCYMFLRSGEEISTSLSYFELEQQAKRIARKLQSNFEAGERVLLVYQPGIEFIVAFFGCLYAGMLAVPAYPPHLKRDQARLLATAIDSGAKAVCGTSSSVERMVELCKKKGIEQVQLYLNTEHLHDTASESIGNPHVEVKGSSVAYLQYTSGSTAAPRGVMVSHDNLMHNLASLYQDFDVDDRSVFVSWLPHFHDMGLVYGLLLPVYAGVPCYFMSPMAFVQRPARWLNALSSYKATHSAGPNFAYDLCVKRVTENQKATLDLSNWKVALNGAEPVRQDTLERFEQCFLEQGLRKNVFYPGYGLAEATLEVSGARDGNAPNTCLVDVVDVQGGSGAAMQNTKYKCFVSCGKPAPKTTVLIVNPSTLKVCQPSEVGEILVSGPSVANGYWNRPSETNETFRCYLSETGEGPFLRTGDLGFIREQALFIAGRLKDLIIIGGRNIYPQDIEWTVEQSHPLIRPNSVAAFSVEHDNQECFVVAAEIENNIRSTQGSPGVVNKNFNAKSICDTVRKAISHEHDLSVYDIVLLAPGSISKTSSGKIQRQACRSAYLNGTLNSAVLVA